MPAQPASFLVVDDQQPGTTRQLMFTLSQKDSQHNTSGLSSLFGRIPSVLQYQQIDTPQPFSPSQLQPVPAPVPSSTQQEQSRPPMLPVQPAESAQISRSVCIKWHHKGHPILSKTIIQLLVLPKNKIKHTIQHLHFNQIHIKNCVNE